MREDSQGRIIEIKSKFCKQADGKYKHGPYVVDSKLATVECKSCGMQISPIYVLEEFARSELALRERINRFKKDAEKAAQKNRTKCENCGNLTRIIKNADNEMPTIKKASENVTPLKK